DRKARREACLTGEPVVEPGHDPEQGRLAGAVRADVSDVGAAVERDRDVLEDGLVRRVVGGEFVCRVDEFVGHVTRVTAGTAGTVRATARRVPTPLEEATPWLSHESPRSAPRRRRASRTPSTRASLARTRRSATSAAPGSRSSAWTSVTARSPSTRSTCL